MAEDNNRPTSNITKDNQRKFDYFFHSAVNEKTLGKNASAYDFFSYCYQIDSTNATVLFELANYYRSKQYIDTALVYYQKAVKYAPDNYFYNMSLAASFIDNQDFGEAAKIYQKIIHLDPTKVELYMYLSEAYRLDGDYSNSIDALNNLERTMGMNEAISIQKFKLYSALNDKDKAYAEVQKYIDKNPNDIRYQALLANLYLQDDKAKLAFETLTKAKKINANDPYLITTFVLYYQTTNNIEALNNELNSVLFNDKVDVDTKVNVLSQYIGIVQENKNDIEKANVLLDSLMKKYPNESKLNFLYGNLLLFQGKKSDANFQYQIYTETNPSDPAGWEQLIRSIDPDSIDALINICESGINYLPDEPLFYFYLSIGKYEKKSYREALDALNRGIPRTVNPTLLSEFYSQAGNLYFEMGLDDSSFVSFKKALEFNPENLPVLNNYSYYLSLTGQHLDEAIRMSNITVMAEPTNPTYLDTYGWILFQQGNYPLAKVYIENALKYSQEDGKEVDNADMLEHYGDVLYLTGEKQKALEYWIKAKAKGSDSKSLNKKIKLKTYIPPTKDSDE